MAQATAGFPTGHPVIPHSPLQTRSGPGKALQIAMFGGGAGVPSLGHPAQIPQAYDQRFSASCYGMDSASCGVKLLVTSRAPLGAPEERVCAVPALVLPDRSQRPSLPELRETEAIELFVERARAVRSDFELIERNAESVIELCVRVDGMPLALELTAARCNVLSPQALLERLGSRLDVLRAAPGSGLVERQWTLRGAIEWSYDLLQPRDQQLFTSLAVFVDGFTLGRR